ncbi:MAG: hypothetical protein CK424_03875 [Legionella sp.]|nr:MAG: hypothetical protein CK424_03875 [Legionella sp.]
MPKHDATIIKQCLVIGLGRIGLPQALSLAQSGIQVYGFDHQIETVDMLQRGMTPFYEPSMQEYLRETQGKSFFPYASWQELHSFLPEMDAILFTVGTQAPTQKDILNNTKFDLQAYFTLLDHLFSSQIQLKKGVKLIIRTTLPLGSTDLLKHYLENTHGLEEGHDFYLAFVPERVTEGFMIDELKTIPKIIGVYSDAAFEPIRKLFAQKKEQVLRVRNPITAEFCKLTDNSYRSTIFSYANDIAMRASELDVDIKEVIDVVNDHYDRNHIPQPGFVSGYCLSKDPYIFELDFLKSEKKRDFHSVWYYGRKTNDYLIDFVAAKTCAHLNNNPNACVALLGLSFKENVDDFRLSHAFKLMEKLHAQGIQHFNVYDPYFNQNKYTTIPEEFLPYIHQSSTILAPQIFEHVDAIIVSTCHQAILEVDTIDKLTPLLAKTHQPCYLFDGWGCWEQAAHIKHIQYERIGYNPGKTTV